MKISCHEKTGFLIPSHRLPNIDAMRGIAALLVLWLHVAEVFVGLHPDSVASTSWAYHLARNFDFGRMGVVVFFAISGFVIPSSLKGAVTPGLQRFAVRRLLRLYPAFWLSIPFGFIAVWWIFDKPLALATIALNFTMVPLALGAEQVMGHYWTLQTELFFSMKPQFGWI